MSGGISNEVHEHEEVTITNVTLDTTGEAGEDSHLLSNVRKKNNKRYDGTRTLAKNNSSGFSQLSLKGFYWPIFKFFVLSVIALICFSVTRAATAMRSGYPEGLPEFFSAKNIGEFFIANTVGAFVFNIEHFMKCIEALLRKNANNPFWVAFFTWMKNLAISEAAFVPYATVANSAGYLNVTGNEAATQAVQLFAKLTASITTPSILHFTNLLKDKMPAIQLFLILFTLSYANELNNGVAPLFSTGNEQIDSILKAIFDAFVAAGVGTILTTLAVAIAQAFQKTTARCGEFFQRKSKEPEPENPKSAEGDDFESSFDLST